MADWFVGEIRLFPMNWQPAGWVPCAGQTLQIRSNAALYSLLGKSFGGDGVTTFMLPDLRGRAVISRNYSNAQHPQYQVGNAGGAETVALTNAQTPAHNHNFNAVAETGNFPLPKGSYIAAAGTAASETSKPNLYGPPANPPAGQIPLNAGTLSQAGGGQGHPNMQPYLVLNYCIATVGTYPSRN